MTDDLPRRVNKLTPAHSRWRFLFPCAAGRSVCKSSIPVSLAHTRVSPVSSVVVPSEVHVANVELKEREPQPDGHAIVAEIVSVHVCSRCRKCLVASACARHRLALGSLHQTTRPRRRHPPERTSRAASSPRLCSPRPPLAVSPRRVVAAESQHKHGDSVPNRKRARPTPTGPARSAGYCLSHRSARTVRRRWARRAQRQQALNQRNRCPRAFAPARLPAEHFVGLLHADGTRRSRFCGVLWCGRFSPLPTADRKFEIKKTGAAFHHQHF